MLVLNPAKLPSNHQYQKHKVIDAERQLNIFASIKSKPKQIDGGN
jgi:hypothetical protein